MTELLEAALEYGELGLRIFPLWWSGNPHETDEKDPKVAGTPMVRWRDAATRDRQKIREWWGRYPEAGIGLACGDELANGRFLFVIDLDRHDAGHDGLELWDDLEAEHGSAPETPRSLTGGGGLHLPFTAPYPVTNARGTLPRGIDVRGRGGYVILPPSSHKSGGSYEWEAGYELGEVKIGTAPDWLLDILSDKPEIEQIYEPVIRREPDEAGFYDELDDRPGTEWAARTSWADLLLPDGWTHAGRNSAGHDEWVRPGKDVREGISATTGFAGSDTLVVHSTNANVPADSYSKLGYLATAHFGGRFGDAAKSLVDQKPTRAAQKDAPSFPKPEDGSEWPEPLPLSDTDRPPSFPLHVFPDWVRRQIEQAADEMQLEPDLPAMLALGALSAVSGGYVEISVETSYVEPANLYLVTALPPGAGKSPVFKFMIEKPLGDFERDLDESGAAQRERNALLRRAAEKAVEKAIQSGNEDEILSAHAKLSAYEEEATPKIFVDDVTVERLAEIMKEQKGKLALVSTEGGLFDQITGRYSEKTNLDPYLMAWSGDTIRVDRIQRGELRVYDPALTVALTVQPTVIEKLADRPELAGRGLTARFMYAYPIDRVGLRDFDRGSSYDPDIALDYGNELLDLAHTLRGSHDRQKLELRLSPEAALLVRQMKKGHEVRMRLGGDLYEMREWITKAQSSTIRTAALLHLAARKDGNVDRETGEILPETVISASTFRQALDVLSYWEAHARRVHDLFSLSSEMRVAQRLLAWVEAHVEPGEDFSLRDVTQWSRSGEFARVDAVVRPLADLVEAGWVRPHEEGPIVSRRGKPSPIFTLSPLAGGRLIEAHEAHEDGDTVQDPTIRDHLAANGGEVEPMSLMSQETNEVNISTSEGVSEGEGPDLRLMRLMSDETRRGGSILT